MKPYLRYFSKCTFSDQSKDAKCFHILGVDVMIDDNLTPWILEINANPSFSIDATSESKKLKKYVISPIDLHVKSM
jgi:tubulin polyglutamylase TTLL11